MKAPSTATAAATTDYADTIEEEEALAPTMTLSLGRAAIAVTYAPSPSLRTMTAVSAATQPAPFTNKTMDGTSCVTMRIVILVIATDVPTLAPVMYAQRRQRMRDIGQERYISKEETVCPKLSVDAGAPLR